MTKTTVLTVALLLVASMAQVQANPVLIDEMQEIAALNNNATTFVEQGKWDAFSENLVIAIQSEYDGVKSAALGMIIRYGDQLHVERAVFDVMKIYRNHDNEKMQRMALVALGQMNNDWAINFLERAERFEKSPVLRQTIRAVVKDYNERHAS